MTSKRTILTFFYQVWALLFALLLLGQNGATKTRPHMIMGPILDPDKADNGKMELASTFGEYRGDHIHMGIDVRTRGKVGLPLIMPEAGYFHALGYDPQRYGLYLTMRHLDGTFSKFGHLDGLAQKLWQKEDLSDYKEKFSKKEAFSITRRGRRLYPKGSTVAYSGATGVGPPHIHFEYLNRKGDAVNPLLQKGWQIRDPKPPQFTRLILEPVGQMSEINGRKKALELIPHRSHYRRYRIRPWVRVRGAVRLKVAAYDHGNTDNMLGLYSLTMQQGNKTLYSIRMDRLPFEQFFRVALAYDVEQSSFEGIGYVYNLFSPVANALTGQKGKGLISFAGPKKQKITIIAQDINGNKSTLALKLHGKPTGAGNKLYRQKANLTPKKGQSFAHKGGFYASFAPSSVLRPTHIDLKQISNFPALPDYIKQIGSVFALSPYDQHLEKKITIKLPVPAKLKNMSTEKIAVYRLYERNSRIDKIKELTEDDLDEGFVRFQSRQLGVYGFLRDIARPRWLGSHFSRNHHYSRKNFRPGVYIKDIGSGVDPESVRAFLNKRRVKARYNPHRSWISFEVPESSRTYHRLTLHAQDKAGNKARQFSTSFYLHKGQVPDKEYIAMSDDRSIAGQKQHLSSVKLDQENVLLSPDNKLRVTFAPNSIKNKYYANKIFVVALSPRKVYSRIRWNLRSDKIYLIYVPRGALNQPYSASLRYSGGQSGKTGLVSLKRRSVSYPQQSYEHGHQRFFAHKLSGSHRLAVYYDNSAPQWGEMLFQEKKIYEKHNIRIGGYLFDEGFGVDSKSIKALVGQKRYPVTYNRKKHLLRVKIPRKDLTKGFHRLRIWAEDRAGNPAKKIDKYFIIRYKPKWGTAY